MDLKVVLTVVAMTLTGGYFVWGMETEITLVDARVEQVEKTQRKVIDWMDEGIQAKRKGNAQRELLRQLCATGQVTDPKLCAQVAAPPTRLPDGE
jgi:hypothetical protein